MNKKIGIDARFYGEAGPGRYVKNIVEGLERADKKNEYYVFLRERGMSQYNPVNKNFIKVKADYKWYSFAEQFGFLFLLLRYRLNLFYVPHFNIPVGYPGTIITAIPDLIMHTYSTEKGTTLPHFYFRFKKIVYRVVVWWAVIRAKAVIVPSQDVKNDFLKVYPKVNKDKFVIAYEGLDKVFYSQDAYANHLVLENINITKPYLLYISSMYEHKNVIRLINAYKILTESNRYDFQLVLVGKSDKYSRQIEEYVRSLGLEDRIIMPGQKEPVDDIKALILRKKALLYVFPSLKEGFSLTPLEAQVCGLPCLISDIPIHREIYGDTAYYCNPLSEQDIAMKINDMLVDEKRRVEYITRGYENAKKYSWDNTAKITLDIFKSHLDRA